MDTYSVLREFADSWFLVAMFVFFVGNGIRVFLPGHRKASKDAALIPFREDAKNNTLNHSQQPELIGGLNNGGS